LGRGHGAWGIADWPHPPPPKPQSPIPNPQSPISVFNELIIKILMKNLNKNKKI